MLALADRFESQSLLPQAINTLNEVVRIDATSEGAHQALMRIYARTGQQQKAIKQYEHLCSALQDELAAEPDPASQKLYDAIQTGQLSANDDLIPAANLSSTDLPSKTQSTASFNHVHRA